MCRLLFVVLCLFSIATCFAQKPKPKPAPKPVVYSGEQLYSKFAKNVVTIKTEKGTGTGFFDAAGDLYTAYHVVKDCTSATIVFADGKSTTARWFNGVLAQADVALLSPDPFDGMAARTAGAKIVPFASVKVGDPVFVIGSPLGLQGTLTEGMVSAKRTLTRANIIQLSAAVDSGSSGSPVFNVRGEIVGMVTSQIEGSQGLNFAVSGDELNVCFGVAMQIVKVPSALANTGGNTATQGQNGLILNPNRAPFEQIIAFPLKGWKAISVIAEELPELGISASDIKNWAYGALLLEGVPTTTVDSQMKLEVANDGSASESQVLQQRDDRDSYLYVNVFGMKSSDTSYYYVSIDAKRAVLNANGAFTTGSVWSTAGGGYFGASHNTRTKIREAVEKYVAMFVRDWKQANPR